MRQGRRLLSGEGEQGGDALLSFDFKFLADRLKEC